MLRTGYSTIIKESQDFTFAIFDGAGRSRDPDTQTFNVSMRFTIHYQERQT